MKKGLFGVAAALIGALTLVFWAAQVGAQGMPVVRTDVVYGSGSVPGCRGGTGIVSSASVATPDRFVWGLEAGGVVGLGGLRCAPDDSRDFSGFSLGVRRRVGIAELAFDVRRYTGHATETTLSSRIGREVERVWRSDSMPGGVDTLWTYRLVTDTGSARVPWHALDLRTRFGLSFRRVAFDFVVGGTTGSRGRAGAQPGTSDSLASVGGARHRLPVRMWGRADVRVALTSFMSVTAGIASLPEGAAGILLTPGRLGVATPPRRVATLGVGISSLSRRSRMRHPADSVSRTADGGRSARTDSLATGTTRAHLQLVRSDAGSIRLRVHLPSATRVDFTSELTGWTPIAMRDAGDGWWEIPLRAAPGTYRMNIRADDGAWTAPPGVPAVGDEFGGTVGLVTIG